VRYVRATDLDEALAEVAGGALPLAGGSVVVPLIARGELAPSAVVDLGKLTSLRELRDEGGELVLGAAVTLAAVARVEAAGEAALPQAAAGIGNPLVRRIATVGGNVASRLPTADLVPALLALDATVVWAGSDADSAIAEVLANGQGGGRLLESVRIRRDERRRSGFVKFAWREATGAAVASVALAGLEVDGRIREARLAVGALVAPRRLGAAEAALEDGAWSELPAEEAAAAAAEEASSAAGVTDRDDLRPRLVALGVRRLLARLGAP
jgi:carbon-monoxide dehydrogenase medium subunit